MSAQPPAWWVELQREMALLLTTPLDDEHGRFAARADRYPSALVARIVDDGPGVYARLSLYHEQYWKRLFNALQQAYPRTTRALGAFTFNRVASRFLSAHPPAHVDLGRVAEPFFPFLRGELASLLGPGEPGGYRLVETSLRELARGASCVGPLSEVDAPWSSVAQALNLDEAERRALCAPREPPFVPTAAERARLGDARMRVAASFSLVRVDYDLTSESDSDLRRRTSPEHHLVIRTGTGVATLRVDPLFARLLARARDERLGAAIEAVSQAAQGPLRARFAENLEGYLDRAFELGVWVGEHDSL